MQGVRGFLPLDDLKRHMGANFQAAPGKVLEVVVTQAPTPNNVVVTCDPGRVGSHVASDLPAGGLAGLLPGTCVNARVLHVLPSGLQVKFLDILEGSMPLPHALPVRARGWVGRMCTWYAADLYESPNCGRGPHPNADLLLGGSG